MDFNLTFNVTSGGGGGPATAQIEQMTTSNTGIAPVAMMFRVDASTLTNFTPTAPSGDEVHDRRYSALYYYWDFGEGQNFTAPAGAVNSSHINSRYAHGFMVSHVFRSVGSHTVSCRIVDPVNGYEETATLSVTVTDPDTVFTADNQTIVVDPQSRVYAPYPNATVVTSFGAMVSTIKGFNDANTPRRVIFRRGETYTSSGAAFGVFNLSTVWPSTFLIAADEAGAKPIINQSAGVGHNPGPTSEDVDIVFQNLVFNGEWDPTTETGNVYDGYNQNGKPPVQTLFDGVEFYNHDKNASTSGTQTGPGDGIGMHNVFFNDSVLEGHREYNFIGGLRHGGFIGCRVAQDPDAYNGPANRYGEIRFGNFKNVVMMANHFYTKGGSATLGNYEPAQPNIRLDTDGVGDNYLNMQGNIFEGGRNIISSGTEGGQQNREGTWVLEKNYLLSTHTTRIPLLMLRPGMMVRNNIIVVPDVSREAENPLSNIYTVGSASKVPAEQQGHRYEFIGNSIVIQLSGNFTIGSIDGTATGLVDQNNIVYTSGDQTDGPLSTTTVFTPRELGYKDSITPQVTATATPAGAPWSTAPQTGAGAIGAATGTVAGYQIPYDDYFGNERTQNFIGAVPPE